tara:strand:+ start:10262 stop:16573 length:6312 start_codon:yes stop_codon:yes gene_type:complete
MADKLLNTGDVYTNPVGDNVVVIDPNKVLINGEVKDRLVNQEDLVMYANLSARIFPRSKILAGGGAGDEVVIDVFDGELNFLKPKGKDFLDSDWTEAFTNPEVNKQTKTLNKEGAEVSRKIENQNDFQGFGITSINVKLNSSYIPQVSINFTDVRGKTLFEQARVNTPYTAFFHLPYPTFFLTLKGFYGKAIKYQLTLEKFVSRFDPSSGDYLITCDFKGNHIAMLRDINMHEAITAPYMFPNQSTAQGTITSTKGRETMSEVYSRYKQKKLLAADFPEYTLVELIEIVKNLDNDLGKLFGTDDLTQTSDKVEYDETLKKFKKAITGKKNSWSQQYLDKSKGVKTTITIQGNDGSTGNTKTLMVYPLKFTSSANNDEDKQKEKELLIEGASEKLNELVAKYVYLLDKNPTFREEGTYPVQTILNDGSFNLFKKSSVNTGGGISVTVVNTDDQSRFQENKPYFLFHTHQKSFDEIMITTRKLFEKQAEKLANDITAKLNTKLEKEIGFKPTIRNVFAIILAGADTFLKLMDQTHTDAFNQRFNETRLSIAESSDDLKANGKKENQMVFPWPQYYITTQENKCTTSSVLTYPGAKDVIDITKGDNKVVWPEIDFVEEYTKTTAYKFTDFQFPTSNAALEKDFTPILIAEWPFKGVPYSSLESVDIYFGILDRADMLLRYGWYNTRFMGVGVGKSAWGAALNELSTYESQNIYNVIKEFPDLLGALGKIGGYSELWDEIKKNYPTLFEAYILNDAVYDPTILSYVENNAGDIKYELTNISVIPQNFAKNYEALKEQKHWNSFFDLVPAEVNSTKLNYSMGAPHATPTGLGTMNFFSVERSLSYDTNDTNVLRDYNVCYFTSIYPQLCDNAKTQELLLHGIKPRNEELKDLSEPFGQLLFYEDPIQNMYHLTPLLLTEGPIRMVGNPTTGSVQNSGGGPNININIEDSKERITSMLNTPYFINSLIEGVGDDRTNQPAAYRKSAYLFLNSLPLPTFREIVGNTDVDGNEDLPTYISSLFNQLPAIHELPLALLLRIGSVWWRYKHDIVTQTDPLTSMWGNLGRNNFVGSPATAYDPATSDITLQYTFIEGGQSWFYQNQTPNSLMVGVYPQVIDAIHYITTGQNSYTNMGAGQVLNNILGTNQTLNITTNTEMGRKLNDGADISFHDVYLDSQNITNQDLGASFTNQVPPERYYILYPSSGGLVNTDAALESTGINDMGLQNGACKLFWKGAHYGYFEHKQVYLSRPWQYFKNVDPETTHQPAWNFYEPPGTTIAAIPQYSTMDELFAVFSKAQLDKFENLFLSFANADGKVEGPLSSMKQFIKEITILPESFVRDSAGNINTDIKDVVSEYEPHNLANAQYNKLVLTLHTFLNYNVEYAHQTTNNLDSFQHGMTTFEAVNGLLGHNFDMDSIFSDKDDYNFGKYIDSAIPVPPGGSFFVGNPPVWQAVRLNVGEFHLSSLGSQPSDLLVPSDESNPIYKFFTTCKGLEGGIEFTIKNVEIFAPVIRMYATHCATVSNITADKYLQLVDKALDSNWGTIYDYVDGTVSKLQKLIADNLEENETRTADITDDRPSIEADNLKLELYTQFKTLNDRWVAGTDLSQQTLFERFLFFDRANRDIGDEAIINIWDIIQLDSPFADNNTKTLTQSVASYLSTILANNYFNFIPLPAYINFFNISNNNSQLQGNAMFGTFKTVDYLESQPAFLCQYVGPPSSQLNVDTPNNGYKNDTFTMNRTANNPLLSENCGNKQLSNKVMGFNVDFGIPNQNIFESVTLDQSQFQDTSESFKILQDMADSGGGGATSTASLSLFNIYANRSYTASITCMGNVSIQPTQYFQLRYLPMFNGPYLILNVEHNVTPNNIETTFQGVRVPIPTLPKIDSLVQRVNKKIYQQAEQRFKGDALDLYLDNLSATKNQLSKTPLNNGYVDTETHFGSPNVQGDGIFRPPISSQYLADPIVDPEIVHLGFDFVVNEDYKVEASSPAGINVRASIGGIVIDVKDGCNPLQKEDECGKYGNYVEVKTIINEDPTTDNDTSYYITRYAFLRKVIGVKKGDTISKITPENTIIGQIGNSGLSEDIHLHFEIVRYLKSGQKIIKHYLQPAFMIQQ